MILFEVLCGRLAVIGKYDDERRFLSHLAQLRYEEGKIGEIIFPNIRKQIKLNSLLELLFSASIWIGNDVQQWK